MTFEEVSFDLDDKNLFLVDDLKLKAEAIRHSILPKLQIITNQSISKINERLKTNVLELSTVLKFPNFRKSTQQTPTTRIYPALVRGTLTKSPPIINLAFDL